MGYFHLAGKRRAYNQGIMLPTTPPLHFRFLCCGDYVIALNDTPTFGIVEVRRRRGDVVDGVFPRLQD